MGVDSDDYSRLLLEDLPNIEAWMGIGTAAHGIPNRISYHFNLMGASAAMDAACASSLVAVHCGSHAIKSGESRVAIVGGVNVCVSPAMFHMLSAAGALSADGVCQSFDDAAHGYSRGEGAAVLILKRLSHAIADNDHVIALLKGVAVAQDGKTDGIMAPNAKAQELVARKALKLSDIDPLSVGFVEAHATATSLGDPTEISALSKVYGTGRAADSPALLGSIKPNVEHMEAAAGAISLVKAIMAVDKGCIPPQAKLNKLNSRIDWDTCGLQVVREATKWSHSNGPRRAAVCSYGYGGTVSHAIVEQSPVTFDAGSQHHTGVTLMVLSAPQERRLIIQSAAHAEWISTDYGQTEALDIVASTLALRRSHHEYRAAFVVDSHAEAAEMLQSFSNNATEGAWTAKGRTFLNGVSRDAVWVFSGHGAQWSNMAKELLQNTTFKQVIAPLDEVVTRELGWSAMEALETGKFEGGEQIQVVTYLMHIGLAEVLKSKGIQPQAIIGHSMGEIAASVVAGALTAEEGAVIVTQRARLYIKVKNVGGMYLVRLPFQKVVKQLGSRNDIAAAIASSPSSCIVSGATEPLAQYIQSLHGIGVKTFKVNSDIPFHSPMLEDLIQPLEDALADKLQPQPATVKLYSTSHSDPRSEVLRDVDYWTANMVQPVWLTSAIAAAAEDGYGAFLEISPHPIILHSVNEILDEAKVDDFVVIPTMRKGQPVERTLLHSMAQLYVKGVNIDFAALLGSQWSSRVPGFQWTHRDIWRQVSTRQASSDQTHDVDMHDLLGQRSVIAGTDITFFTTQLEDVTRPYPHPHEVHGVNITPAAVYANTFFHATGARELSDMALRIPLAITERCRDVQVVVQGNKVKISSRTTTGDGNSNSWVTHSEAHWTTLPLNEHSNMRIDVNSTVKSIGTRLANTFSIDHLAQVGVSGMAFPWSVLEHYGNAKEMIAKVDNDLHAETSTSNPKSWAPPLDAASSIGSTVFQDDAQLRVVSKIDRVQVLSQLPPPKMYYIYAVETKASEYDENTRSADVSVVSVDGEVLARLQGLRLTEVDAMQRRPQSINRLVHQLAWVPARLSENAVLPKAVLLICHDEDTRDRYRQELSTQVKRIVCLNTAQGLGDTSNAGESNLQLLSEKHTAVILVPGRVQCLQDVAPAAKHFIWESTTVVRYIVENKLPSKLFVICDQVFAADTPTALAHAALYGLARVAASEHSDIWGGLIDNGGEHFPFLPFKYVHGQDVIRFIDGVPKVARFRAFTKAQRLPPASGKTLLPKPEGTYVVAGGLGALGQATTAFLVDNGACRILVLSRRALPPRAQWSSITGPMAEVITHVRDLEKRGATLHVESLDLSADDACQRILDAVIRLALPPVLGVIHACGILEDSFLLDTTADSFERVLGPKIAGAIALHRAFPPGSVDFFIMYSSVGQLIGIPGQSSYGSGNAFLDALAAARRNQGDNAIAFQFTSWRGLGMGVPSDFITNELNSKGITDMSPYEGFRAWEHMSNYDTDHAVVTPVLTFDEGESLPLELIEEVAPRRRRARDVESPDPTPAGDDERPSSTSELKAWLSIKIRESIASLTQLDDINDIDPHVALSNIGVDSVMSTSLRAKLQSALKIKVPQTLTWNFPTVAAMVEWFTDQFER